MEKSHPIAYWLLTLGLAFVFGWFGIDKIVTPLNWIGWIPGWMDGFLGMDLIAWTKLIGVAEIVFAAGLFIPWVKRYVSALVMLHLIAVIAVTRFSEIGIRDIGLFFMAAALLSMQWKKS